MKRLAIAGSALLLACTSRPAADRDTGAVAADVAGWERVSEPEPAEQQPVDTGNTASPAPAAQRPAVRPAASRPAASVPAAAPRDTARGYLALVGAAPVRQLVLRQRDTTAGAIMLHGPHSTTLSDLRGMEVWVGGTRDPGPSGMVVDRFVVRSVAGVRTLDGRLAAEGSGLALDLTEGGRVTLEQPLPEMKSYIGRRIWMTGDPTKRVERYGVIPGAQ